QREVAFFLFFHACCQIAGPRTVLWSCDGLTDESWQVGRTGSPAPGERHSPRRRSPRGSGVPLAGRASAKGVSHEALLATPATDPTATGPGLWPATTPAGPRVARRDPSVATGAAAAGRPL